MPGRHDHRTANVLSFNGVLVLAASVCVVGCQPSSGSSTSDAVRQKLKDAAATSTSPSDVILSPTVGGGPAPEPVRRFAVRPFEEWTMRETAAAALGRIGKPAVPKLVEALRSPNPALRHQAADTLARIGPSAAEAVPALIAAMKDDDPLVRKACARALGQIGPDAADAVPGLIEMLLEDEGHPASRESD